MELRISTEEAEKIIAKHLMDIGYEFEDEKAVIFKTTGPWDEVKEFQTFVTMPRG